MSDQFRKRWDIEHRRQKTFKPDYLEEIKLDNYLRREFRFGRFEIDSDFRKNHPTEFAIARRNRDQIFLLVKDPPIFIRESPSEKVFIIFPLNSFQDFAENYELDFKNKFSKQLFQRLHGYAKAIQILINDELRQWPMRVFVNPPLPRQFHFSNKLGMAAAVTIFNVEL